MTGPRSASGIPNGTQGYGETADVLVTQYESRTFADVHRGILPLLPAAPARALDIGAGTGRDAAALAALGHTVLAVEPTPQMRAHGQRLHPSPAIEWLDDSLPELARVRERGGRFDLSLRHGPVPAGRRMVDVGSAETRALATRHGLSTVYRRYRPSSTPTACGGTCWPSERRLESRPEAHPSRDAAEAGICYSRSPPERAMPDTVAPPQEAAETAAERRASLDQALASTRLEGHMPTPEFLSDCEDYIAGRIARDEIMARSTARALATERAADAA